MSFRSYIAGLLFVPALLVAQSNDRSTTIQGDLTADQAVLHVLNRLAFGPRPTDVAAVRKIGVEAWVNQQLMPQSIADPHIEQTLRAFPLLHQNQAELAREYTEFLRARTQLQQIRAQDSTHAGATMRAATDTQALRDALRTQVLLVSQLNASRVARAVTSERQLLEVMTDFWKNHFNIFAGKGPIQPFFLADFDKTIRQHALGKFRDLLGAVAHSPAMLYYLDNATSRANPGVTTLAEMRASPARRRAMARAQTQIQERIAQQNPNAARAQRGLNENYGRELLELHTLGVDGGYTQEDVINVARALTGWAIKPPAQGSGFLFIPQWHDAERKVVLGRTLPAGRGEEDGEDVLDILARHPATAKFIATKLAIRFVSDTPPAALIERAANTFVQTDGDIREVVRTIVTSPEFFSRAAYRAKVKSPFEVVVSAARALGAPPDTTPRTARLIAGLGQPVFGHQAPDGWPETGDEWMNTGAILNRINFGAAVASNRLPGMNVNALPWAQPVRTSSREQQTDAVILHILGGDVSPDTREILLSGVNPLAQSPPATDAEPEDDMSDTPAPARRAMRQRQMTQAIAARNELSQLIGLAIGAPEFQRR